MLDWQLKIYNTYRYKKKGKNHKNYYSYFSLIFFKSKISQALLHYIIYIIFRLVANFETILTIKFENFKKISKSLFKLKFLNFSSNVLFHNTINYTLNLSLPTGGTAYGIPLNAMYSPPKTFFTIAPFNLPCFTVTIGSLIIE